MLRRKAGSKVDSKIVGALVRNMQCNLIRYRNTFRKTSECMRTRKGQITNGKLLKLKMEYTS